MYPDMAEQGTTNIRTVVMGIATSNKGYVIDSFSNIEEHVWFED
jgi:hypothetical protein